MKKYKVLGLMSGSSLDGLDIAFCEMTWDGNTISDWQLIVAETLEFSEKWATRLFNLPLQNALTFAQSNVYFGHYLGDLVNRFIKTHQVEPDFIASHGHTIYHYPDKRVTVQIGDGAALAAKTGYPVICDFRTQDIAIDGEGAPIAPIADKFLFGAYDFYLNLGGIANITCAMPDKHVAFDVGAANQVLNILAHELEQAYDHNGEIAATGNVHIDLLNAVNSIPYFQKRYPKTLDNQWVAKHIFPLYLESEIPTADKLRTACEQIAIQVAQSVQAILKKENLQKKNYRMLATGGGAFNGFLMDCIQTQCLKIADIEVIIPADEIVQFKEAILMGLMGVLRLENQSNCLRSVTGARRDTIGGAIYQGSKKFV